VSITIEPVPAPTREVEELLTELDEILGAAYAPEQRHAQSIDRPFQPDIRFYLARLDGEAMGCGGVALFDDYAEVKEMYVREPARGRGIGKTLLAPRSGSAQRRQEPIEAGDRRSSDTCDRPL
jgi:putative acetyltransferase